MTRYSPSISRRRRTHKGKRVLSRLWYGRQSDNDGKTWRWVKLFDDRRASERAWEDRKTQADRVAAGLLPRESERLQLPLLSILDLYIADLGRQNHDAIYVSSTSTILRRAFRLAAWSLWQDLTVDHVGKLLDQMDVGGATVSHRNGIIKKLKAFCTWATPAGYPSPLAKLKRLSERGARQTRGRRAGTPKELAAIFSLDLPRYRRLSYALAAFNGLRRNETARLDWADIDDERQTITVRHKMGGTRNCDVIPLHPFVLSLLGDRPLTGGPVVVAVPDPATIERDWKAAGVAWADKSGLRLDYHALRHTFSTMVERAGAGRSIHRRLMRHEHQTVTDRYTHAEIDEMRAVLNKIPWPLKTGGPEMDQKKTTDPPKTEKSGAVTGDHLTQTTGIATFFDPAGYPSGVTGTCKSPGKNRSKSSRSDQDRTRKVRRKPANPKALLRACRPKVRALLAALDAERDR